MNTDKEKKVDLPYFDFFVDELENGNPIADQLMGRNVHWGYWEDPSSATGTIDDFVVASDQLTQQLIKWIEPAAGQRILDVGCGFGGTVALLNEQYEGLDLTGLNIDERQIERARTNVQTKVKPSNSITFVVGNACELPFPDNSFDHLTAVECIFHFPSRTTFFQEASRVLKPGGKLVLSDFISYIPYIPLVAFLYLFHRRDLKNTYGGARPVIRPVYRAIARKTGFTIHAIEDITKNTLPTYDIMRKYASILGPNDESFLRANRFIEQITKLGAHGYEILVFQKD